MSRKKSRSTQKVIFDKTSLLNEKNIIGLGMRDKLSQELASSTIRDALGRGNPKDGLIHHSDRGRQYASYAYQELLREYGLIPSMCRI